MWSLELSQQLKNLFGIIVLQFLCHPPGRWDLILSWLCPSYHLIEASPLSLDVEYLFLMGFCVLLSMVVQQLVVILVFSQKKMRTCPSSLLYWNNPLEILPLLYKQSINVAWYKFFCFVLFCFDIIFTIKSTILHLDLSINCITGHWSPKLTVHCTFSSSGILCFFNFYFFWIHG